MNSNRMSFRIPMALLLLLSLGACSTLPPVNHHYRNLQAGTAAHALAPFDEPVQMTVYYVTNRKRHSSRDSEPFYSPYLATKPPVTFGTIQAVVPRMEPMGGLRAFDVAQGAFEPGRGVKVLPPKCMSEAQSNLSSHASALTAMTTEAETPTFADLESYVAYVKSQNTHSKPILLYVHGFNNEFHFAVGRAARFVHDMGGSEFFIPMIYSWPAYGSVTAVTIDENNTGPSSVQLSHLLRLLMSGDNPSTVQLVVHSMGTRVVSQALLRLSHDQAFVARVKENKYLKDLIVTAGDMDALEFSQPEQVKAMTSLANRVSIYVCDHDVPLYGSMFLHSPPGRENRRPRIGQAGENRTIISEANVETIDATMVELSTENHAYLFENRMVLDDVFMLLRHDLPAAKRNLLHARDGNDRFFLIRR